jgi:hypothetical protein
MYYLEDHTTSSAIFVTEDVFLARCLKSGILDCTLRSVDSLYLSKTMKKTLDDSEGRKSLRIESGRYVVVDLTENGYTLEKVRLARIRSRAFRHLLKTADQFRNRNLLGYCLSDTESIAHSLTDDNLLSTYAAIMGIDIEFARQELTLRVESKRDDDFRIFVLCERWTKRINECESESDIDSIIEQISHDFNSPGSRLDV